MFKGQASADVNEVKVKATSVRLNIDYGNSLILELPPVKELLEINSAVEPTFPSQLTDREMDVNNKRGYELELGKLLKKQEKHKYSSTYYKFLSDAACGIGDHSATLKYIKKATELSDSEYLQHEYGDRLLDLGLKDEAYKHFSSLESNSSPYALLRLAHFYFISGDLSLAEEKVYEGYSISSNDFGVRSFLGAINLVKNEYELAVRNFRVAIDERPNSSASYASLVSHCLSSA